MKKIETSEKLGDIFTKGLTQATFEYLQVKIVEEIVLFLQLSHVLLGEGKSKGKA